MPATFQHFRCFRDVFWSEAGQAKPLCLQVNRPKQTDIIQHSRDRCSQHHFGIADCHKLRHDKTHRAHDRRRKLAAGRSDCLHRSGKFLSIAGFLHQRDGNRARGSNIGNCGTIDHTHHGRGNH